MDHLNLILRPMAHRIPFAENSPAHVCQSGFFILGRQAAIRADDGRIKISGIFNRPECLTRTQRWQQKARSLVWNQMNG